jgi:hypothetical protein
LEEGDNGRGLERVFSHAVKVRRAEAIRGAEARDLPLSDFAHGPGDGTFQDILGADGHGEVEFGNGAQKVNMPE